MTREDSTAHPPAEALRAVSLACLATRLATDARLLGLDISKSAIGVAVSDGDRRLAVPLCRLPRKQGGAQAVADGLRALLDEHRVGGLVVGLPLTERGLASARVRSVRGTMRNLVLLGVACPWAEWDERHSTRAVERMPVASGKDGNETDTGAATWILQGALDWLNQQNP